MNEKNRSVNEDGNRDFSSVSGGADATTGGVFATESATESVTGGVQGGKASGSETEAKVADPAVSGSVSLPPRQTDPGVGGASTDADAIVAKANLGGRLTWRTVDLLVATVLAVACGLIFVLWNSAGYGLYELMNAVTPGFGGLANGIWFLGGVLGASIIRKPGAAIYVETLAAIVEMALGSQWGVGAVISGLAQGLGAEVAVALFAYRRFGVLVVALAGILSGLGAGIRELADDLAKGFGFIATYWACTMISGLILAGLLGYFLSRLLAKTGVLSRFEIGRKNLTRV